MPTDYDGAWKEVLDVYLQFFLRLLFRDVEEAIDWNRLPEILDKELQQIAPKSATGKQFVDKLVRVWLKNGTDVWVLIHIEVQTWKDDTLPQRVAHYRWALQLKYNRPIASLVVLADDDPDWTVKSYTVECLGSSDVATFSVAKLMKFADSEEVLESSSNPFARFVLAHLKTRQTSRNPEDRLAWKLRIIKGLYDQKLPEEDVARLIRFIDWLMELPTNLVQTFDEELQKFQKENNVPFVTQTEQLRLDRATEKTLRNTLRQALNVRFGAEGEQIDVAQGACSEERFAKLHRALLTGASLEEAKAIWAEEQVN